MKFAVLTRNPAGYTLKRLREACKQQRHTLKILDTLNFSIHVRENKPALDYDNAPCPPVDVVIPRIGHSITSFGTAVVRQFEQMGVFCMNGSTAITMSRDKLRSLQILSRHDIGLPATAFVRQQSDVLPAIEKVGGTPVIIKLLEGSQGIGVILADNVKIAEAIIETLQSTKQSVLIQRFVAESKGRDIRAFVVGGHVVAAMRRRAQGSEFRSNVHRGGLAEAVSLDADYMRTAVKATQIMGLRVAGVDMLEGKDGPQVMEVNSSPGLEGIEAATGVDIAGEIIRDAAEQARFPEVDLRQRLSVGRGYQVVELPLDARNPLAGRTLAETELRDREVLVLQVERGGLVFPAPKGDQMLLEGDRLLCYGKRAIVEEFLPPPKATRKRAASKTATKTALKATAKSSGQAAKAAKTKKKTAKKSPARSAKKS